MARQSLFTSAAGIEYTWEDQGDGNNLVHGTQDLTGILDRNRAMANHNDGYTPTRELRRVAHIPAIIRNKWLAEEGWDAYRPDLYGDKLMRKLNDPDWQYLRTAEGQIGISNGIIR
jgi:hypothetical protein